MHSNEYLVGVGVFFSVLVSSLQVWDKKKNHAKLTKITSFILVAVWVFVLQFVIVTYLWPFWTGQYNIPGWLAWCYHPSLPVGFGFWSMIYMNGNYLYVYVQDGESGPSYDADSYLQYLTIVIIDIPRQICTLLKALTFATLQTIFVTCIEWLLYKCYVLTALYYVFVVGLGSIYTVPLHVIMWCYTDILGFKLLVLFVLSCFCFKHCLISCRQKNGD